MGVPPRLPNSEHRDLKTEIADMLEMETMISGYSIPTLYSPPLPGKRKREEDEEEKETRDIFDHRVPTMVERKEEVNNVAPPSVLLHDEEDGCQVPEASQPLALS